MLFPGNIAAGVESLHESAKEERESAPEAAPAQQNTHSLFRLARYVCTHACASFTQHIVPNTEMVQDVCLRALPWGLGFESHSVHSVR